MAVIFALSVVAQDNNGYVNTSLNLALGRVLGVRAANANEIKAFPTALTAVDYFQAVGNSQRPTTFLSPTATATVVTLINT